MSVDARASRSVAMLVIVFGAMGYQVGAWALSLPSVVNRLHLEIGELGLLLSLMALAAIVATVSSGWIAARVTVRIALAVAAAVSGLGYILMPFLSSYVPLVLGAVFTGLGLGLWDVMANTAGSLEERRQGRTFLSGLHAAFSFGAACAVVISFAVNGPERYDLAFLVAGALCLVGAAVSLGLPVTDNLPMNEEGAEHHDLRPVAFVAATLAFVIVVGSFTVDTTMEGFSALFIQQIGAGGPGQSALGLTTLYLAGTLGRALAAPAVRLWGDWRALLISILVATAGAILLTVSGSPWATVAGMLLIGVGLSPSAPISYSVMGRSRQKDVAKATGRLTTAGYATFVLAPLAVGMVGEDSLRDAFRLLPILLVLMAAVTIWFGYRLHMTRSAPHDSAEPEECRPQ